MRWLRKILDGLQQLGSRLLPAVTHVYSDKDYCVELHGRALSWSFRRNGIVTFGTCRRMEVQASLRMLGGTVHDRKTVRISGVTVDGQNPDPRGRCGDGVLTICYPHPFTERPVVASFNFDDLGYCPDLEVSPGHRCNSFTFSSHPQAAYAT